MAKVIAIANQKGGEEKPEVEMLPPREYGKTRDKVAAAVVVVGTVVPFSGTRPS